jgi:hypothetical protein
MPSGKGLKERVGEEPTEEFERFEGMGTGKGPKESTAAI